MLQDNKTIHIKVRKLTSAYAAINKKRLDEVVINRTVGSSITSVNKITANTEEQKSLMSDVIGVSPISVDWNKDLKSYWNGFTLEIPDNGKALEIGFVYDIGGGSERIQTNITRINANISKEYDKLTKDIDLKNYIDNRIKNINQEFKRKVDGLSSISNAIAREKALTSAYKVKYDSISTVESERYLVGRPINAFEYMVYRYVLGFRDVANEPALVSKSPHIRFYLHSETDIKKEKKIKATNDRDKMVAFIEVTKDVSNMENFLYAFNEGATIPKDDVDKYEYITKLSNSRTEEFIRVANDKDLNIVGTIEKYIIHGVLKRLSGSQTILNPMLEENNIVGNTMEEAIKYFKSESNRAIISSFENKYKSIPIN